MIRIGIWGGEMVSRRVREAANELRLMGLEAEWLFRPDSIDPTVLQEAEETLLRGDIDAAIHPLKDLPVHLPGELVVTALSPREEAAEALLIRREAVAAGQPFLLKPGAVLGVSTFLRRAQMAAFRPDLSLQPLSGSEPVWIDGLLRGDCDAILLDAALLRHCQADLSAVEIRRLSPREVIPAPGQGVLAYLTLAGDKPTRRLLRRIHHPDVSARTNVERQVLRLLGGRLSLPLGVYCETDPQGNYHVWAARAGAPEGTLRRARLSSSTSFGLAERVAEALEQS